MRWAYIAAGVVALLITVVMVGKLLRGDLKDAPVWYDAGRRVLTGQSLIRLRSYRYPPTFAVLIAPLAALPFPAYVLVWHLLNMALFALTVRQAAHLAALGQPRPGFQLYWLPALLVLVYAVDNLFLAQTNILVMALVYASFCYLARGKEWWAGLPLAASIAIKVFPAPMLAYLLYRWRLRAVASTLLATAFFLFLLPAPVRGLGRNYLEVKDWGLRVVEPYLTRGKAGDWGQHALDFGDQSIQAVAHRYLTRVDANVAARRGKPIYVNVTDLPEQQVNAIVLLLFVVLAGAFVVACGWRRPSGCPAPEPCATGRGREAEAIEYSLVAIGLLLASAIAWTYFFVMLLLPIAVAVRLLPVGRACRRPPLRRRSTVGLWFALSVLVLATALLRLYYPRALGSVCLVSIILYVALAMACWDLRRLPAAG